MYSLIFLAFSSFALSLFLTPVVRNIFRRIGLVDKPDSGRKVHARPVPRVGGVAIALSYTLAFILLFIAKTKAGIIIMGALPAIVRVFPAAVLMFGTGLVDDLVGLKPWKKLAGQTCAAVVAYLGGIRVHAIGGHHLAHWWALPATIFWLVGCANALNLMDGMDGLATGIGLVASTTALLAAIMQHNVDLMLATVPLVGCLLAFLRYNFNPATVFLGDSGSLFIGFLLGCYGVLWSEKSATLLGMTAPLMALAIPLLDTTLAIARRFLRGQPIFLADRGHIHHRLLERGLTPRRAVLVLYGLCTLAAMFSLSIASHFYQLPVVLAFCVVAWIGIQRLGYIEFDTAGRMLREGSFLGLLNSHISLRGVESSLLLADTPEDCWTVMKNNYKAFGFHQIHAQLAGHSYADARDPNNGSGSWRLEIPLADSDYVCLTRDFDKGSQTANVASFADVLRKTLQWKLASFARLRPHSSEFEAYPSEPQLRVVSAGH